MSRRHALDIQVSIHAPAWGATAVCVENKVMIASFNPRPRMGGDENRNLAHALETGFNPRPRMGGDLQILQSIFDDAVFQSTPPHGGRP